VNGWTGEGKGRIYRFVSPDRQAEAIVAEVKTLLSEEFGAKPIALITQLLRHADQRVRMKAQFELADRVSVDEFTQTAESSSNLFARLHAMWGLEQIARRDESAADAAREPFRSLLADDDAQVRAQAVRLLGEFESRDDVTDALRERLADDSTWVRYFAAMSLGKLQVHDALGDIVALLEANDNQDPALRHAGVMTLSRICGDEELAQLAAHDSIAVRLAAVVALRRQHSTKVAIFLHDDSPLVVLEAARAIHDAPIPGALPKLADLIARRDADDALLRRVLNANFRLGAARHTQALARFAAGDEAPKEMRLESIDMLANWEQAKAPKQDQGVTVRPTREGLYHSRNQPSAASMRNPSSSSATGFSPITRNRSFASPSSFVDSEPLRRRPCIGPASFKGGCEGRGARGDSLCRARAKVFRPTSCGTNAGLSMHPFGISALGGPPGIFARSLPIHFYGVMLRHAARRDATWSPACRRAVVVRSIKQPLHAKAGSASASPA